MLLQSLSPQRSCASANCPQSCSAPRALRFWRTRIVVQLCVEVKTPFALECVSVSGKIIIPIVRRFAWAGGAEYNPPRRHGTAGVPPLWPAPNGMRAAMPYASTHCSAVATMNPNGATIV
jgi:hypothetical protein